MEQLTMLLAAPSHEVTVAWCREDASPGIHLITPGLLQLNVIRYHRQLVSALTSRSKCHRTPYHWRAALGPYHSDPAAASLAPGLRTSHLQACLVGFQGFTWSVAPYLADNCQLLADTGRRQLRSSDVATCSVLRTHSSLGDRCFAAAAPRTCNRLPIKLRQPDLSLEQFRRLKLRRIILAKDYGA